MDGDVHAGGSRPNLSRIGELGSVGDGPAGEAGPDRDRHVHLVTSHSQGTPGDGGGGRLGEGEDTSRGHSAVRNESQIVRQDILDLHVGGRVTGYV